MTTERQLNFRTSKVSILGTTGFVLGFLPLLGFTFFSPGLGAEGVLGMIIFGAAALTFLLLITAAKRNPWFWILVVIQMLLLAAVLVETFSDSMFYIGT